MAKMPMNVPGVPGGRQAGSRAVLEEGFRREWPGAPTRSTSANDDVGTMWGSICDYDAARVATPSDVPLERRVMVLGDRRETTV